VSFFRIPSPTSGRRCGAREKGSHTVVIRNLIFTNKIRFQHLSEGKFCVNLCDLNDISFFNLDLKFDFGVYGSLFLFSYYIYSSTLFKNKIIF
jgi:hypothetical protein